MARLFRRHPTSADLGSPRVLCKGSREDLRAATGDTKLPALKLADGTVYAGSKAILGWIATQG